MLRAKGVMLLGADGETEKRCVGSECGYAVCTERDMKGFGRSLCGQWLIAETGMMAM